MLITLFTWIIKFIRKGQLRQNEEHAWHLKNHMYSVSAVFAVITCLTVTSIVLEIRRESGLNQYTMGQVFLPVLVASILSLCTCIEEMCLYKRLFNNLTQSYSRIVRVEHMMASEEINQI